MATNTKVDVTGINLAKVAAMQQAIDEWAAAISAAKITNASKNVTVALKGTKQQQEIKSLCQAVESYSTSLTSKLREYNNRLTEVKAAYMNNDNSATSISTITSGIKNLKS